MHVSEKRRFAEKRFLYRYIRHIPPLKHCSKKKNNNRPLQSPPQPSLPQTTTPPPLLQNLPPPPHQTAPSPLPEIFATILPIFPHLSKLSSISTHNPLYHIISSITSRLPPPGLSFSIFSLSLSLAFLERKTPPKKKKKNDSISHNYTTKKNQQLKNTNGNLSSSCASFFFLFFHTRLIPLAYTYLHCSSLPYPSPLLALFSKAHEWGQSRGFSPFLVGWRSSGVTSLGWRWGRGVLESEEGGSGFEKGVGCGFFLELENIIPISSPTPPSLSSLSPLPSLLS